MSLASDSTNAIRFELDVDIEPLMTSDHLIEQATREEVIAAIRDQMRSFAAAREVHHINRLISDSRINAAFPHYLRIHVNYEEAKAFMGSAADKCRNSESIARARWTHHQGPQGWGLYFRDADDAVIFKLRFG